MLDPTIFREYDIRGIAGEQLHDEGIELLGRAIGTYLRRNAGSDVNLGRDCRLSSPRLAAAIARGLVAAGCRVTGLGTVPTPLLYYSVARLGAAGGVMITGSHNPPDYNGFKVVSGDSTIHGDQIQLLRRMIETRDLESGTGTLSKTDIVTPYVDEIAAQFRFDRRTKVVFDAGNGAAGPVMHRILEKVDCDAVELFFEMDGRFPNHHPDPTVPAYLQHLIGEVRARGADLGIAFDGDGDRIGAVDEKGAIVWGDQLMLIYAREILSRKPGATFIGEVKCSQTMYDGIRSLGGNPVMWKTGHSLIKAKMKELHAELAGEMSGHMFFADRYYGFDDAIYSACRLIEIVARTPSPLSAQLVGVPMTVTTPEIRVDCDDRLKFEVVRDVTERFRRTHRIVDVDGVRVLFPEGWGLVRASNTQPVLVLRFEASSRDLLEEYRRQVETVLEEVIRKGRSC